MERFWVGRYISSLFLFLGNVCPTCYCESGKNSSSISTSRSEFTPLYWFVWGNMKNLIQTANCSNSLNYFLCVRDRSLVVVCFCSHSDGIYLLAAVKIIPSSYLLAFFFFNSANPDICLLYNQRVRIWKLWSQNSS